MRVLRVLLSGAGRRRGRGHQLASGDYHPRLRVVDSPETVIRKSTESLRVL